MSDIAVYEPDSGAECTGGSGAVAILVGPNAPLVLERQLISTHMADHFDFYKPVVGLSCEYPRVDGKNSLACYLDAVENCYNKFRTRYEKYEDKSNRCLLNCQ